MSNTSKDWLDAKDPQADCPYCGADSSSILFESEVDGDAVFYQAYCLHCGKSWGQEYHLIFVCNFEDGPDT